MGAASHNQAADYVANLALESQEALRWVTGKMAGRHREILVVSSDAGHCARGISQAFVILHQRSRQVLMAAASWRRADAMETVDINQEEQGRWR